jgi:hypothetical protein
MKNKRHHYIPSSYLSAWHDPECPKGYTPYVWIFSKDGTNARKKQPDNIFFEKDLYTIHDSNGERDLTLEFNLSRLEGEFAKLRKQKLSKHNPLEWRDSLILCMFVMAMHGRTISYRNHHSSQWKKALDMAEKFQSAIDNASPEQRDRIMDVLADPHPDDNNILSIEDVRDLAERPIQNTLSMLVTEISLELARIPFVILETQVAGGFITSDNPCVWFDPASYENPREYSAGGLLSPTLEITLPISPTQMLIFGRKLIGSIYIPNIDEEMVHSLNKRTRLGSHEYFVANNSIVRSEWF